MRLLRRPPQKQWRTPRNDREVTVMTKLTKRTIWVLGIGMAVELYLTERAIDKLDAIGQIFLTCQRPICSFSHLLEERRDSLISSRDILFHSFAICALILWSSCINFGSFIANLAHLLRRTYIDLHIIIFFVHRIYTDTRFMPYYMSEVPAYKNRNFVERGNGYMQGISQIFTRYYFAVYVFISKYLSPLCFCKLYTSKIFYNFEKFFSFGWVRCPSNFISNDIRNIKFMMLLNRLLEEIFSYLFYPDSIFNIQPIYNRGINIYSHNIKDIIKGDLSQRISLLYGRKTMLL